jgi:hypothetical protein
LAKLRNHRFFSAADLNLAIGNLVRDINARLMKGLDASRAELFATIDKPALKDLPDAPYAFAVWKRCRVAPDYHTVGNAPPAHDRVECVLTMPWYGRSPSPDCAFLSPSAECGRRWL